MLFNSMNNYLLLLILIIIICIIYYCEHQDIILIYAKDIEYFYNILFNYKKTKFNIITRDSIKNLSYNENANKIKLLIMSFDNRKDLKYLNIHNKNILNYAKKYNIDYKFSDCMISDFDDKNVYWYKLYLMLNEFKKNEYDYIMWMDTDTIFVDSNINLLQILYNYPVDIFIGTDYINNFSEYINYGNILCAGIFIIANSQIGINFITECIDYYENTNCDNKNLKNLNGFYAGRCYEQGTMNNLLYNKYYNNTLIFGEDVVTNTNQCFQNTFILHFFGKEQIDEKRIKCFSDYV